MKTVCVFTGTRAEYGILRPLLEAIDATDEFRLQLLVSGTHLSPEFGLTWKEIDADGFEITERVENLVAGDSDVAVTKAAARGLSGYGEALARLSPDLVVILGDRYEALSMAFAAAIATIPIAHLHGGEVTHGAYDDGFRHAITKLATWHFTATEIYRRRVIQLGETPDRVFNVGALSIDNIRQATLLSREEWQEALAFRLGEQNLLVTFHPPTIDKDPEGHVLGEVLDALRAFPDVHLIFTYPNADSHGRAYIDRIEGFVAERPATRAGFASLGMQRYLSALALVDGVVGNSSSGITEAPAMGCPTVNIGNRQDGRIMGKSIVSCRADRDHIQAAITRIFSADFRRSIEGYSSPYGDGHTASRVVDTLRQVLGGPSVPKTFYDLPGETVEA